MKKIDHLNLTVKQLKLFLMVLESKSVGSTAVELELNQSTVSYSLDKLREVFSDPLFVKQGRGIVPTAKAERIAPQIRDLLLELEAIASADYYNPLQDFAEFTIAANVMELFPYVSNIVSRIRKASPKAAVRVLELGSRHNVLHLLETQSANVAISVRPPELPKSLQSLPLLSHEQVCFYDPNVRGPVNSVAEFCKAPHATLDFGGTSKSTIDYTLEALSLSRNIMLKAPNIIALANLMKGTNLIATMQTDLHNHALQEFKYCPTPISVPVVNFDLIWHRRSEFSARNDWLRKIMKETINDSVFS